MNETIGSIVSILVYGAGYILTLLISLILAVAPVALVLFALFLLFG